MVDSPAMKKSFTLSDIKPLDLYDATRAKTCASVGWLLGKSYGSAGEVRPPGQQARGPAGPTAVSHRRFHPRAGDAAVDICLFQGRTGRGVSVCVCECVSGNWWMYSSAILGTKSAI